MINYHSISVKKVHRHRAISLHITTPLNFYHKTILALSHSPVQP